MIVPHLWNLSYILSIINRATGIFFVKLQFSDSCFSLCHVYVEPLWWERGRYLPMSSILDLNCRICMLFSKSLMLANLTGYCENGAAPSGQLGKLPNWQLVHCCKLTTYLSFGIVKKGDASPGFHVAGDSLEFEFK